MQNEYRFLRSGPGAAAARDFLSRPGGAHAGAHVVGTAGPLRAGEGAEAIPRRGLASPDHTANLSGPVLGCIAASAGESTRIFSNY